MIAFVLFPHLDATDKAFPTLVNEVVPAGLSGLIIAAMVAALMSSADSVINSWGTLFTYDIYRRLIDKGSGPRRLVLVGRLATVFLLSIAVIRAPMLRGKRVHSSVFSQRAGLHHHSHTCPFCGGYLLATGHLSWGGCHHSDRARGLLCRSGHAGVNGVETPSDVDRPIGCPMAVAVSVLIVIIVSLFTKTKEPALLKGLIWTRQDTLTFGMELLQRRDAEYAGTPGGPVGRLTIWKDYRLMGFFSLLLMAVLVWWLR